MENMQMDKLRRDVDRAWSKRAECLRMVCSTTGRKSKLYQKKFDVVNEQCWQLQDRLDYYESDVIASDNDVEIRRKGDSLINMYWIYLSGHPVKIGHIDYRGYHFSVDCGDVGYFVDDRFSGNDYAYKSLVLLSDFLFKNDIHDFYITVSLNNPASLKIVLKAIQNYGGSVIRVEDDIVTFQCKTRLKTRLKGKA